MAQQGGQQSQGGGNESLDFLWMIVVVILAAFAIWYFYEKEITHFIFLVRLYEIKLIRIIMEALTSIFTFFTFSPPDITELKQWESYIKSRPVNISFEAVEDISQLVGRYLAYPVMISLSLLGFFIYRKHVVLKFKTIFNMQTLKKSELSVWPQSKPTVNKDLISKDIHKGPWAMAKTPLVFCKEHKIIKSHKKENNIVGKLIKGPAYRVFSLQTGRLWPGVNGLKIHVKALMAIFAAKANHDTARANKLLDQISDSSASGQLDFSGVQETLNKYYQTKIVQKTIAQHAYLLTVMASMLELARMDGVLASAEFLWLKAIDRPMWYMLNSVGRRVAVPEIAGAFAHWLSERSLRAPIRTPMVDAAVKAMEVELENTLYEEDDDEEK